MAKLTIWLTQEKTVTLDRTAFAHPLLGMEQRAVRGKTSGAYSGYASFQWTPAVQGMVILLLRTLASQLDPHTSEIAVLEGGKDSPASSLDYSIGKLPNWVLDIFGVDSLGQSLARRVFRRTNPERKRPGPVAVSVNSAVIGSGELQICVNGQMATDAEALKQMAQEIEQSCFYQCRNLPNAGSPGHSRRQAVILSVREHRDDVLAPETLSQRKVKKAA